MEYEITPSEVRRSAWLIRHSDDMNFSVLNALFVFFLIALIVGTIKLIIGG